MTTPYLLHHYANLYFNMIARGCAPVLLAALAALLMNASAAPIASAKFSVLGTDQKGFQESMMTIKTLGRVSSGFVCSFCSSFECWRDLLSIMRNAANRTGNTSELDVVLAYPNIPPSLK